MSPQPVLYLVEPSHEAGRLSVVPVWSQHGTEPLAAGYSHLFPITAGGALHLAAVDRDSKRTAAFRVQDGAPWISPVESDIDLADGWDVIEAFQIGSASHLLAYNSARGQFAFFPITRDLRSRPPYLFARRRGPDATAGFDVVQPIVVGGFVYYLCYGADSGRVVIYSLSVTAANSGTTPPLVSSSVWVHGWARKWTRFAFFELGGETFFLKTNIGRLNVNIDHVLDNPAAGTTEVRSQLDLENALELDIVRSFYLRAGDPYFVTYMKNGETTFNRLHGDCQGWDTEATLTSITDATHVVPLRLGERCYILFY
jgi:hypothetical protein